MTVVIDCNVLVMCLTSKSPYHLIYQALVTRKFDMVASLEIILEYEEIIQRKYGVATASSFISLVKELPTVKAIYLSYRWNLIHSDPDDNKYVDCAIVGKADYLITEDNHFNVLRNIPFPSITTLRVDDFMNLLLGQMQV